MKLEGHVQRSKNTARHESTLRAGRRPNLRALLSPALRVEPRSLPEESLRFSDVG